MALCRLLFAVLHLSMVATAHAAQQTLAVPAVISQPYLLAMNSPALRFRELPATTPLVRKPIASGPPVAASEPEVAEVALANNHAAASTPPIPASEAPTAAAAAPAKSAPTSEPTPPPAKVKPILPDDTPQPIRSEDFLPLFRFPTNNGDVVVPVVPTPTAPGTLPVSSATYKQE